MTRAVSEIISRDGTHIAYESVGDGPPLVLVHGTATSRLLWSALGYVRRLSADRHLILADLRGHGTSGKPHAEAAYAIDRLVDDVLSVMDAVDVDQADYLGYSLGARVGFRLALRSPERVRTLTLGGGSHRPQQGALDRLIYPGFAQTIAEQGMEAFLATWSVHLGRRLDEQVRAIFLAADPKALVPYLRQTDREPGFPDDALRGLAVPTALFAGEHDGERLADSRAAARLIPNAQLTVIPDSDHGTTLGHVDEIVDIVTRVGCQPLTGGPGPSSP